MSKPERSIELKLALAGAATLFLAYFAVFALTLDEHPLSLARDAAVNAIPAFLLGILFHQFLNRFVWHQPPGIQLAAQLPLAALFALSWYLLILIASTLGQGWLQNGLSVPPFVYVAFVWQMFQGVTLYAVIALFSQVLYLRRRLASASSQQADAAPARPLGSLLVRTDGELVSIDPAEIVRISGAGDYSEIVTARRQLLSSTPLSAFEADLAANDFIRVHRSHLVRLAAVEKAEASGNGRLILLLSNGDTIHASRSGARLLRTAAR